MELIVTGSFPVKWLRLDRTIRDLTYGDLEIPLVLIRRGVTGPKKNEFICLLDLLVGRSK